LGAGGAQQKVVEPELPRPAILRSECERSNALALQSLAHRDEFVPGLRRRRDAGVFEHFRVIEDRRVMIADGDQIALSIVDRSACGDWFGHDAIELLSRP